MKNDEKLETGGRGFLLLLLRRKGTSGLFSHVFSMMVSPDKIFRLVRAQMKLIKTLGLQFFTGISRNNNFEVLVAGYPTNNFSIPLPFYKNKNKKLYL